MGKTTKDYEGWRDRPYRDPSGKNISVGYGINISDPSSKGLIPEDVISGRRPLSKDEGEYSFNKKMSYAREEARKNIGKAYDELEPEARVIVDDIHYNGAHRGMPGFIKAISKKDYGRAADELEYQNADKKTRRTAYYDQTGNRAKDHISVLRNLSNNEIAVDGREMRRQFKAMKGLDQGRPNNRTEAELD